MSPLTRRHFIGSAFAAACHTGGGFELLPLAPSKALGTTLLQQPASNPVADIHKRSGELLQQLSAGLDYYGFRHNYVPILSIGQYESAIAAMITSGKSLQTALTSYQTDAKDREKKRALLESANAESVRQLGKLASDAATLLTQQAELGNEIEQLDREHLAARADVLLKVGQLNASLRSSGCSVFQVITIAGAVIAGVVTLGTDTPVIVAAASAALKGIQYVAPGQQPPANPGGFIGQTKTRINDINVVKGQFEDLAKAYKNVQAAFPSEPVAGEVDASKFLIEDGDFKAIRSQAEESIKKLQDSPAKQAYLASMDHYLAITQARNQQLLTFDGLTFRLLRMASDRDGYTNAIADTNAQLNQLATTDPQAVISTISGLIEHLRRDLQFAIYQQVRAMDYWSLQHEDGPQVSADFVITEGSVGLLADRKLRMLSDTGGPPGSLKTTIELKLTTDELATFVAQGTFNFYLDLNNPAFTHLTHILISEITVDFKNHDDQRILPIGYSLLHSGYHRFLGADQRPRVYTSKPRPVGRTLDGHGNETFTSTFASLGDASFTPALGNYVGVSPCTRWSLTVYSEFRASLSDLQSLVLTMNGGARIP